MEKPELEIKELCVTGCRREAKRKIKRAT